MIISGSDESHLCFLPHKIKLINQNECSKITESRLTIGGIGSATKGSIGQTGVDAHDSGVY